MIRVLAGLLASLLLCSCSSTLLLNEADVPARLEQLIADQQYRRTLTVIDSIKPQSALYEQLQQLRQDVVVDMESYDSDVVTQSAAMQKNNQWQQAKELLEDALPRLPKDSRSQAAYQAFLQERSAYISDQELKLNLLLGERMVEEGEYRQNIQQADPTSWSANWAWKRYQGRRDDVAEYLASQGLAALDDNDYGNAKKYLKLAQQLKPDNNVKSALNKINEELDQRWSKYLHKREQEYNGVVAQYRKAINSKAFPLAQQLLAKLQELNPKDNANKERQQKLDSAIDAEIASAIARGEAAYSDGDVKLALRIWRTASDLSPQHPDLLQHISRAEKFLENYESLK
ncbi:hypothetical protein QSV34_12830 [Porticoccus sp. W117]|uniref:hypothetical protein n=1 Tax=Porticoccus sp. W117 TaxID=3054777 RepID=UPI00259A5E80|nr:hypothetical protein [Porticoccus sp. W117]MDM3872232.1 hypothetical protein [Porticoccus sp. W117]